MKHLLITILLLSSALFCSAAYPVSSPIAEASNIPDYLKVETFINMTVSEFQKASGHKLDFMQRIYFKKLQRKLNRLDVPRETTILPYYDIQKGKFKFDALWFIIGCIIGPFAILFAYTSKQPKNKRLSAFIGLGVFILLFGWIALF